MTPLRSCGRSNAFTLIELLVVLAIAGLLAAVAVPSAARALSGANPRSSLAQLRSELSLARAEALRQGSEVRAIITTADRRIDVSYAERSRSIRATWLAEEGEPREPVSVRFDSMGRSDRRKVQFVASPGGGDASGIIWRLTFDPLSGAVGRPEYTPAGKEDTP